MASKSIGTPVRLAALLLELDEPCVGVLVAADDIAHVANEHAQDGDDLDLVAKQVLDFAHGRFHAVAPCAQRIGVLDDLDFLVCSHEYPSE